MYYFNFITAVQCLLFLFFRRLMWCAAIQCPIIIYFFCRHRSSNLYNMDLDSVLYTHTVYRLRLSLTSAREERRIRKKTHNRCCDIESLKWNVSHAYMYVIHWFKCQSSENYVVLLRVLSIHCNNTEFLSLSLSHSPYIYLGLNQ